MNFEPQKFFIGLIDFFSILLPGALLTYVLKENGALSLFGNSFTIEESEGLAVFLFSSYLLGHFIFLIGAFFLDDYVYDNIRNHTPAKQIEKIVKEKSVSNWFLRFLAGIFFTNYIDASIKKILKIKEYYLGPLDATSSINAFQWSKVRLNLEYPGVLTTIQRFEADSKFFRSFVVVLLVLLPFVIINGEWGIIVISILMIVFALWRYINQRAKSIMQTYWHIITIEANKTNGYRHVAVEHEDDITHAGGVVYKIEKNETKYLLVQAKNKPNEWVLPKGHIEQDESIEKAAVREIWEEAGVWAFIERPLKVVHLTVKDKKIPVQFYLMKKLTESIKVKNDERKKKWETMDWILESKEIFDETKELLKMVNSRNT